jgi:predicted transcriptional regulator
MISQPTRDELEKVKKTLQETEDILESIGPNHALYATFREELDQLKDHLKVIEKLADE